MKKPKRVKSPWVCPECGGRATKIVCINKDAGMIHCQQCEFNYDHPNRKDGTKVFNIK